MCYFKKKSMTNETIAKQILEALNQKGVQLDVSLVSTIVEILNIHTSNQNSIAPTQSKKVDDYEFSILGSNWKDQQPPSGDQDDYGGTIKLFQDP